MYFEQLPKRGIRFDDIDIGSVFLFNGIPYMKTVIGISVKATQLAGEFTGKSFDFIGYNNITPIKVKLIEVE